MAAACADRDRTEQATHDDRRRGAGSRAVTQLANAVVTPAFDGPVRQYPNLGGGVNVCTLVVRSSSREPALVGSAAATEINDAGALQAQPAVRENRADCRGERPHYMPIRLPDSRRSSPVFIHEIGYAASSGRIAKLTGGCARRDKAPVRALPVGQPPEIDLCRYTVAIQNHPVAVGFEASIKACIVSRPSRG